MKYLLLLALIGFFSWPYYHRMRSFQWEPDKSYIVGLIPSIFLAFGIAKTIIDLSNGVYIDFAHLPDLLTKTTFIIICLVLTGVFCWLMFTAEWMNDSSSSWSADGDGAFYLAVCMFAICVIQAFFVTDLLVKAVMVV